MMDGLPMIFSIVGVLFGLSTTTLMGMAMSKLKGIDVNLEQLNGKVFAHLTASDLHEVGLVRLEEQVKQVLAIAKVAHERADRLEAKVNAQE